jgi:hypothetical protein
VLLHLAQTNEMAAASAHGQLADDAGGWTGSNRAVRTDVDDIAAHAVEGERGASGGDVRARWVKSGDDNAATVGAGAAVDLCRVAGQRGDAMETSLRGSGPDAAAVLRFMRTFA